MDFKEMSAMLAESATDSDGRYIPWWEDDFTDEECEYEDNLFTAEEIREIEECAKACGTDDMTAPVSGVGYPLFHLLVWHNFYNAVKKALDDGVDANLNDSENRGVTPLLLACTRGNLAMAVLLLDHGADASCRDVKGRNCFHYLSHPFAEEMKITEDPYYSLDQREAIARLLAGLLRRKQDGRVPHREPRAPVLIRRMPYREPPAPKPDKTMLHPPVRLPISGRGICRVSRPLSI